MNKKVIIILGQLADTQKRLGNKQRELAYKRAARSVAALTYELSPPLPKIPGVGKHIGDIILDILTTGKSSELERARDSSAIRGQIELAGLLGAGSAALTRWRAAGVETLAQLRVAVGDGVITLNKMQKLGLAHYADLHKRIPRPEVAAIGAWVSMMAEPSMLCEIAGSYRRGAADSGDIDIIITTNAGRATAKPARECIFGNIAASPRFIDTISAGPERVTFLYKSMSGVVRQIDLLFIARSSRAAALLYFTGSWEFNEAMRGLAKSRGFRLNQRGLFLDGRQINTPTEQSIFARLGLRYVAPAGRVGPAALSFLAE